MTLSAELDSPDEVRISGSGQRFLRFKSEVISACGIGEIRQSQKGSFSLRLGIFKALAPAISSKPDLSEALSEILDLESADSNRHSLARKRVFEILDSSISKTTLGDEYWDRTLQDHQALAVAAMTIEGIRGLCLFDEQGTGKTLTTIAAFDILVKLNLVSSLYVVAPKTLLKTWKTEFQEFLGDKYQITEVVGNSKQRQEALNTKSSVFLLSYETASTDSLVVCGSMRHRKPLLVIDESFLVKNESAQRSQGVERIREFAERAFVLCGTPAPNNAYDLVHQFNLADRGFTFSGFTPVGDLAQDGEEIERRIANAGTFIRRTKELVLPDLASKKFEVIECEMTDKQSELYTVAKNELVLFLKRLDNTTFKRELATYFQKRAALTQISVSPQLIGDPEIDSGKYRKLVELVDKELNANPRKKLLVWSAFTKSSNHIAELLSKWGLVRVDGTNANSEVRQEAILKFQTDPNTRIFLGNPSAAGAGITLTAADTAIYVSISNQAAPYMQSIDRIHRIGQTATTVRYVLLVSKGTLDQTDVEKLSRKQANQSWILGDPSISGLDLAGALAELG